MKGIRINEIPMDLLLKYFREEDLQDRLLEPSLEDDVRDYYEYEVSYDGDTYTYYSNLILATDNEGDFLALEAYRDLLPIIPGLNPEDITSGDITLEDTIADGQMYESEVRVGASYPHRYRFEDAATGDVLAFLAIGGSIDEITTTSGVTITDTRDGSNPVGVDVDLTLNSVEERYYVYTESTTTLLGYIYENTKSRRQKVDSEGRPLYVDESGNDTTDGFRGSSITRHSEAIRRAFFPEDSYVSDARQLSFTRFLPGVVGVYKQGDNTQLIYRDKFLRTKDYERVVLSGEDYSDVAIPEEIKDNLTSVGDTYSTDAQEENKLRVLLDFGATRSISARFYDEPSLEFSVGETMTAPAVGGVIIVKAERRKINYENSSYVSTIVGGLEKITVDGENLDVAYDERTSRSFLRIPVKKELNSANTRYYLKKRSTNPDSGSLFDFSTSTKTFLRTAAQVPEILSTNSESDFSFGVIMSGYLAHLKGRGPVSGNSLVLITSTMTLKKVMSNSSGLESATVPSGNRVFSRSDQAFNGAQADSLYTYSGSSWTRSSPRLTQPTNSEIYDEYVTIGATRYPITQSPNGTFVNPTIKGTVYQIKTDSTNAIYQLGYIEHGVRISDERSGVEYFGQVTASSGSNFTIGKYSPTYSDQGFTGFDMDEYTYDSMDDSYSKTYYLRDFVDRSFAVEVVETISKSGDNADSSSTPKWTEFIDYDHVKTDSGSLTEVELLSGRKSYRTATAVSSASSINTFISRFGDFEHSLVDGSLRISLRGDFVPGGAVESDRKRTMGRMALDFLNRPGSNIFTVANIGQDEDSPMKMRIYSQGLLSIVSSAPRISEPAPKANSQTSFGDNITIQRIDMPPAAELLPQQYGDGYFSEEAMSAASSVSSTNSFQRIVSYNEFPTNESRVKSEFSRLSRAKIMASKTSTESAKEDIVKYDSTPRVSTVRRLSFKKEVLESMSGFLYSSNEYSESDFALTNYYKYYKDKLDQIDSPVYQQELEGGTYKRTILRSSAESDPEYLISKILSRYENGSETEWRVL